MGRTAQANVRKSPIKLFKIDKCRIAPDPENVVYMDAGECETADKAMQAVVGRPWDLWKSKVVK